MTQPNSAVRRVPALWLAGAAVLMMVSGCGSTTNVTGKVTYKGMPVSTGSITLVASNGTAYSGILGTDGSFSIPGVPTGEAQVAVVGANPAAAVPAPPPPPGLPGGGGGGGLGRGSPAPEGIETGPPQPPAIANGPVIPPQYADPRTSGLTVKIKAGEPVSIDLK